MKLNTNSTRQLIFTTALAFTVATVGCAKTSEQKVEAAHPVQVAAQLSARPTAPPPAAAEVKPIVKTNQPSRFKSRDYGISFDYPWQYQFVSARVVNANQSLQPKSDGFDGQITLARIDLPKGFYPDTNFESGYFTLSLNPEIEDTDCKAGLNTSTGTPQLAKINDVDFLWSESDVVGKGTASTIRNYVTYKGGICYEIELGVNTRNEDGLAREINADQVMHKLEGMLKTVKFNDSAAKPATPLQSSLAKSDEKAEGHK